MDESKTIKDKTPTWVINKHGVKSCWPAHQAQQFVETKMGFKYAEPDPVTAKKQYPMDGDFTEQGEKNRKALNAKRAAEVEEVGGDETKDLSRADILKLAKEHKIDRYWLKKTVTIKEELEAKGVI